MPNILAIDASTETCSVALLCSQGIFESVCAEPRTHAAQLLPMVHQLLQQANMALAQLDAIAYGAGPGSFTGLRIALSFAQGLAFGINKPLVAVESLAAMAFAFAQQNTLGFTTALCLLDARMDEFYFASFALDSKMPRSLAPAQLCRREEFPMDLTLEINKSVVGLGGGWSFVGEQTRQELGMCDALAVPLAKAVARLGEQLFLQGRTLAPEDAEPVYLRNSVAWNKRKRLRDGD